MLMTSFSLWVIPYKLKDILCIIQYYYRFLQAEIPYSERVMITNSHLSCSQYQE